MLVTCEQCAKSYKVDDSRIPAQGARIKCPSCKHIFLVRPESDKSSSTGSDDSVPPISDSLVDMEPAEKADEVTWRIQSGGLPYTFHDLDALHNWMLNRTTLDGVKVAKNDDDWKLLGDYPEVMTTELITKFFPLGDVPQTDKNGSPVTPNSSTSPTPFAQNMSGPKVSMSFGVAVASKSTLQNVAKSRKTKEKEARKAAAAKGESYKLVLAGLFMLVCVAGVLYVFGVFDSFLKPEPPAGYHYELDSFGNTTLVSNDYGATGSESQPEGVMLDNPQFDAPPPLPKDDEGLNFDGTSPEDAAQISEEEAAAIVAEEAEKILNMARQNIKNKNWPVAQSTLLSFLKTNPDNLEAKQLLVKVYRSMGKKDEADQLEAEIKSKK